MGIPRITLPLLLLGIYLVLQTQLVYISFPGLSYITAVEFFLCIILAIAISSIVSTYGLTATTTILAQALITGAILQSIVALLQYTGHIHLLGNVLLYDSRHPTTNIFGQFGQRNHYCHYLSWAVFSLIYLYLNNKLRRLNFYTILVWFMFSITIAASRSVFIYFPVAMLISGSYFAIKRTVLARKLFMIITLSTIILVAFEYAYPLLQNIIYAHNSPYIQTGLQRLSRDIVNNITDRRIVELHKAWLTFIAHPMLGIGFNEYAQQSVSLQPLFKHAPPNTGLFTNCHNLILQFLAETGIIGTTIMVFGMLWSIYGLVRLGSREGIIILCLVATTLLHSVVEYPLWYFYFLCPLIIFLALDKPLFRLKRSATILVIAPPLAYIVYLLITGSVLFNTLVSYMRIPSDTSAFVARTKYLHKIVDSNGLAAYPAMYVLDNYININSPKTNAAFTLNAQLKYENLFTHARPYPNNLIKLAQLNWNIGNYSLSRQYLTMALLAFPTYKSTYLTRLKDKRYKELVAIIQNYKE